MDIVQIQMAALAVNAIRDMLEMGSRVSVNFCVQNVYSEDCFTLSPKVFDYFKYINNHLGMGSPVTVRIVFVCLCKMHILKIAILFLQ